MKTGTSHFTGFKKALAYYSVYGLNKRDVEAKIQNGEISLGKPITNGKLSIEDGRYFVTE